MSLAPPRGHRGGYFKGLDLFCGRLEELELRLFTEAGLRVLPPIMPQLQNIKLYQFGPFKHLASLPELPALKRLSVGAVRGLETVTLPRAPLEQLSLQGCDIRDAGFVAEYACTLKELDLSNNSRLVVKTLPALGLHSLNLQRTQLRTLGFLEKFARTLVELDLAGNHEIELGTLPALPHLRTLAVPCADIGALQRFGNMVENLSIEGNEPDVFPTEIIRATLTSFPRLKTLELRHCELRSADFIRGDKLRHLSLRENGNPRMNMETIGPLPALKSLDLAYCGVVNAKFIGKYAGTLEELDLSGNTGLELSTLPDLPGLRELDLSGCGVREAGELEKFADKLEHLDVSNNNNLDESTLPSIRGLITLPICNSRELARGQYKIFRERVQIFGTG